MSWIIIKNKEKICACEVSIEGYRSRIVDNWMYLYNSEVNIESDSKKTILVSGDYYIIKDEKRKYTKQLNDIFEEKENPLEYIDGAYSVAAIFKDRIIVGADIFKLYEVFYFCNSDVFCVGDDLMLIKKCVELFIRGKACINFDYMISYIANRNIMNLFSPYKEIDLLYPGFELCYTDHVKIRRYWYPKRDIQYFAKHYENHLLERTLDTYIKNVDKIALCYSAGLDSSVLKEYLEKKINTVLLHVAKSGVGQIIDSDYNYVVSQASRNNLLIYREKYECRHIKGVPSPNIYYLINGYSKIYEDVSNEQKLSVFVDGNGGELVFDPYYKNIGKGGLQYIIENIRKCYASENSLKVYAESKIIPYIARDYIKIIEDALGSGDCTFIDPNVIQEFNHRFREKMRVFFDEINNKFEMELLINIAYWWQLEKNKGCNIHFIYPYLNRNILFYNAILSRKGKWNNSTRELQKYVCREYLNDVILCRKTKGGGIIGIKNEIVNNRKRYEYEMLESALVKNKIVNYTKFIEAIDAFIASKKYENIIGAVCCALWLNIENY